MQPGGAAEAWSIEASTNGTVKIVHDQTGLCMVSGRDINYWSSMRFFPVFASSCADNGWSKWYLLPSYQQGSNLIRNVETNECLDVRGGGAHLIDQMQTHPCNTRNNAQVFEFRPGGSPLPAVHAVVEAQSEALAAAMTRYAMTLCDAESPIVTCSYLNYSESKAALLKAMRVSDFQFNDSPSASTFGMSWSSSKTVQQFFSYSYSAGVTLGYDIPLGPRASVTVTQTLGYAKSWADTSAEGSSVSVSVPPGEFGWIARAQLAKTLTGTWTVRTDMGTSWTAVGTTSLPARSNTDGLTSVLITCTSSSTSKSCSDTAPAAGLVKRR